MPRRECFLQRWTVHPKCTLPPLAQRAVTRRWWRRECFLRRAIPLGTRRLVQSVWMSATTLVYSVGIPLRRSIPLVESVGIPASIVVEEVSSPPL
jgi:hypothetical protein